MKKVSIHFGINKFLTSYYGSGNNLRGCENDAVFMQQTATKLGFQPRTFFSKKCTAATFIELMKHYAASLIQGDTLMFSFSSHGTYREFINSKNELQRVTGICFYDRIMWDNEVKSLLTRFLPGVKIIWITDCCFAQDNFKMVRKPSRFKTRFFNWGRTATVNQPETTEFITLKDFRCQLLAYSSSTQYQPSYDYKSLINGRPMGLFTACLEKMSDDLLSNSYYRVYKQILSIISETKMPQTPVFATVNCEQSQEMSKIFAQ